METELKVFVMMARLSKKQQSKMKEDEQTLVLTQTYFWLNSTCILTKQYVLICIKTLQQIHTYNYSAVNVLQKYKDIKEIFFQDLPFFFPAAGKKNENVFVPRFCICQEERS